MRSCLIFVDRRRSPLRASLICVSYLSFLRSACYALTSHVGHMIQAESDNVKKDEYLKSLMSLPNTAIRIAAICLPNIPEGSNCTFTTSILSVMRAS
jgi:hypothetical protein